MSVEPEVKFVRNYVFTCPPEAGRFAADILLAPLVLSPRTYLFYCGISDPFIVNRKNYLYNFIMHFRVADVVKGSVANSDLH